uniref:Uncharacterized protein n=1 Tax=Anguilla anguilla TaxID=7936 RepID=A0A0E9VXG6_ANGAN
MVQQILTEIEDLLIICKAEIPILFPLVLQTPPRKVIA